MFERLVLAARHDRLPVFLEHHLAPPLLYSAGKGGKLWHHGDKVLVTTCGKAIAPVSCKTKK